MPYLLISDFHSGLDSRRTALTTKTGALIKCDNAHITRGGEIEKRKAFVVYAALPVGTFGLHAASNNLYTFGSGSAPIGMPPNIQYQQLVSPTGANMVQLVYTENFTGGIYSIAKFDDGNIYHYFKGTRVTTWDSVANPISSQTSVASSFAFLINQEISFTATSLGPVITINGLAGIGFTVTTSTVNRGSVNDQTFVAATIQFPTTSLPQISTVTIGGTYEAADTFTMTIASTALSYSKTFSFTGTSSSMGTCVKTFGTKMYSTAQSLLEFSQVNDPTQWGTNVTGSGFIDMSNQDAGSEIVDALAIYQGNLAIFSRRNVQIWTMKADPTTNVKNQVLSNIGTNAPKSVVSFGDVDVFFLSDSGIRSLRARDASNAATVSDIGTNIDTLIANQTATLAPSIRNASVGIIEPQDGRYWLSIGNTIYVYSYFSQTAAGSIYAQPTGSVAAWTTYSPGFNVTSMCYSNGSVYLRDDANNVYIYGGLNGQVYDSTKVEVILPYLDMDKPDHVKTVSGIDLAQDGTCDLYVNTNALLPNVWDIIGQGYVGPTYPGPNNGVVGRSTHIGVRILSQYPGYWRLGNIAVSFDLNEPP